LVTKNAVFMRSVAFRKRLHYIILMRMGLDIIIQLIHHRKVFMKKNQKNIFTLQQKIQENIISGSVMEMIGKTICIIFSM